MLGPQWEKNHSVANDRLCLSGTQRLTDVNRGHIVFSRDEKTDTISSSDMPGEREGIAKQGRT